MMTHKSQHPETRLSLIVRLQNSRDEAAWAEFLMLYEPVILRLLQRQGLQDSDARDVCQQVLAAVAKDVEQWQSDERPASFRRWLSQIARHRVLKFLIKERKRIAAEGGSNAAQRMATQPDLKTSLSAEFEMECRQQMLLVAGEQIRGEFHDITWRAFWLTSIEGRSVADVAGELRTSVGNVYVARSRIIARLRDKVREMQGEDG